VEIVTLAIYADETGGTPLWQETQRVTIETQGRYSILMGSTLPDGLPMDVFASGGARWLGLHFERPGEQEQPRALLTSVPYALRASDADTLAGRPASDYLLAAAPRDGAGAASTQGPGASADVVLPGVDNFLAKYINAGADLDESAVYESGGMVGIGTNAPADSLHVRFNSPGGALTGYAVQNTALSPTAYSGMLFYDNAGALAQFQGFNNSTHEYRINNIARNGASAFDGSINFMIGSSSKFLVGSTGAIGIGTSTGTARLNVRANPSFTATGTVSRSAGSPTLTGAGTRFLTELNVGDRVMIDGTTVAVFSVTSDTLASISASSAPTVMGAAMTILPAMLRVQNSAGGLAFQVDNSGNVSIGGGVTSGGTKVYVTDTNRFTGTSTGASINNGNVTIQTNTAHAADVGAVLTLGGSKGSTGLSTFAGIRGAKENSTDAEPSGYLGVYTVDGMSTFAERMRVTSTGLVGIGTTTPASALEVNGGVRLNPVAAKPACDATVRGTFWVTQGGAGVKDSVEVCAKDAMDTFAWRTLF
jgi:hypothetical protein